MLLHNFFTDSYSAAPYKFHHAVVGNTPGPHAEGSRAVNKTLCGKYGHGKRGTIYIRPNAPCPVKDKEDLCRLSSFPVAGRTDMERASEAVRLSCRPHGAGSVREMLPMRPEAVCHTLCHELLPSFGYF